METKNYDNIRGKALYNALIATRSAYMDRARANSELSIPQLFPAEGSNGGTTYANPYQSLGAMGVNNLANKIVMSLFPPNIAFFKLSLSPTLLAQMGKGEGEINSALFMVEREIINEMENTYLRPKLVEIAKQLIVGGNCVLNISNEGNHKIYGLESLGLKRSKSGEIIQMVLHESINYLELEASDQSQLGELSEDIVSGKKQMDMYTCVMRVDSETYFVFQEIQDIRISGTEGTYKRKDLPYIFIPFVDRGEDYGRSYLEDFLGDLKSLEGLSRALLEGAAESARYLYLLAPNALLSAARLSGAKSGDVLIGNKDDVHVLQADKQIDMQTARQEAEILRYNISKVLLLDSAVRREAERVTAEEVKHVANELEVGLAGIYSSLANKLQKPLVDLFMNRINKQGKLPEELKSELKLDVTTGSAALGRGAQFNVLTTFFQTLIGLLGPEGTQKYLNMPEAISRLAVSLDVNTQELIKTVEELQAEAQAEQTNAMQQQAVGPSINAAAKQSQTPQ